MRSKNTLHSSILSSMALAAALAVPAALAIAPGLQAQPVVQVRVYDRYHHDYHVWDDREDHAYRGYWLERHRPYVVYGRIGRPEQRRYWNWRHAHPDYR